MTNKYNVGEKVYLVRRACRKQPSPGGIYVMATGEKTKSVVIIESVEYDHNYMDWFYTVRSEASERVYVYVHEDLLQDTPISYLKRGIQNENDKN